MVPNHRTRLLNILARLDQLQTEVANLRAKTLHEGDASYATELAAEVHDALLRLGQSLISPPKSPEND